MCAVGHGEEYISDCKGDEELEGQLLADIPAGSVDAVVPNGAERKSASPDPPFCGGDGGSCGYGRGSRTLCRYSFAATQSAPEKQADKQDSEAGYDHHSLVTRVVEKFGWVAKEIGDVLFHNSDSTAHIAGGPLQVSTLKVDASPKSVLWEFPVGNL